MNRIKVLAVTPYDGLQTALRQVASEFEQVQLTFVSGDVTRGVQAALAHQNEGYDAIISRGGTAEMIRQQINMPVISIEITAADILRSLRFADRPEDCVIVGHPGALKHINTVEEIIGHSIKSYKVDSPDEAKKLLMQLNHDKAPLVICDTMTNRQAANLGMRSLLIGSGRQNIRIALERVIEIVNAYGFGRVHQKMVEEFFEASEESYIVFSNDATQLFRSNDFPESNFLPEKLKGYISQVVQKEDLKLSVVAEDVHYDVKARKFEADGVIWVSFIVKLHPTHLSMERYGITFRNAQEARDDFYNSIFGASQPLTGMMYEKLARDGTPAMIVGELGTGKIQMMQLLHNYSKYGSAPICIIDCGLLEQKGWNFLLYSDNSPLMENGLMIHFRQITEMNDERFNQLFQLLRDTHYHRRNHLVFCRREKEAPAADKRYLSLVEWFGCSIIRLKQLKENRKMIPQLASMYVNSVNARYGSEITGIEPEAMDLLQAFDWPANHDQFRRVLRTLALVPNATMITAQEVRKALNEENQLYQESAAVSEPADKMMDGKTMEEIEVMAVRHALQKHHGNQTAAAQELAISRTSLWRMAQKYTLFTEKDIASKVREEE